MDLRNLTIKPWRAELWQGSIMVASAEASNKAAVEQEILHYAMMYKPDGPIEIVLHPPKRLRR